MADKRKSRGRQHVEIARYLQHEGAVTSTQDKYNRVPVSYLPQHAKRVGLNTAASSGEGAVWAIEQVTKGLGVAQQGAVKQAAEVHLMR